MSFIGAALEFLHARKWLVELLLLAAVVIGVYLFCQHLIGVGVQRQKDADAVELAKQLAADKVKADKAEHVHDQELSDLRTFRDEHPFTYRVCIKPVPKHGPTDASHDGTTPASTVGESVPAPDPDITEDRGPLLDAFAALFETNNAALRQWQGR